jgi:pSer/pThr/pTyr-binding forkhead associated (FHA) protein
MSNSSWKLVVVEGKDLGLELTLPRRPVSIGRGRSDDLLLSDPGVTRQQLRVDWDGQQDCYVVEQTGDSATRINNIPVVRLASIGHRLMEGDQIQVGRTILRFVLSSSTDGEPPPKP